MNSKYAIHNALGWGLAALLLVFAAVPVKAQQGDKPSSLLTYKTDRLRPGDGYMVAGDLWDTIKPMNSSERTEGNGVEDNLRNEDYLHYLTIGPDGGNWHDPTCFWPGGYHITNCWRDGRRMSFSVFEADGWDQFGYQEGNLIFDSGDESASGDTRYMLVYYTPNLQGAGDPARDYKRDAAFTDESRTHLLYEAGWPTTAGIDFKLRAHQYTPNDQNLNDFVTLEITMTNTGVVDTDGDGTPETTDHAIDAIAMTTEGLPTPAVRVQETGVRNANVFGAGRTMGYWATPDESGTPVDLFAWYANVPPTKTTNRATPPAGTRDFGINNYRFREGYTDVWNSWRWHAVKSGSIEDGNTFDLPDKPTLFGTHSVGEGPQRGWYTSVHWESSLANWDASDLIFQTATATWYEDYGKTTNNDTKNLAPNSNFFSGGTAGDVTTFVVGDASARPNGDYKYATEDLGPERMEQPVWEPALNPGAEDGSNFYGGTGWNLEYVFSQSLVTGIGPYSLDVGESITVVFSVAAGYRALGVLEAYEAAEWAWERGWDVSPDLPTPPAPDMLVESTTEGTARIAWTDVSGIDSDVDGYKIWRAAQFQRSEYLDEGFLALDAYQYVHEVGADVGPFLDEINPWFDGVAAFEGDLQGTYQPSGWGTYTLLEKIPAGEVSQFQSNVPSGYDYAFVDEEAITGFTYWYYVSAYKEGSFTGPQGPIQAGHIESSNFNRNGRNSPGAAAGTIALGTPWGGTYPFASRNADFPSAGTEELQNLGAPFTVTPPVAPPDQVADLITVTPNPYKITGLNDVRSNPSSHSVDFLNLPADYTLTILDVAGQIVFQAVTDGAVDGKFTWDLFSKDGTEVASGLYIYHVEYAGGDVTGHFAIMR